MGSQQGGVDIEQVAKETPDAIVKHGVDIINGLYQIKSSLFVNHTLLFDQ